MAKKIYEETDIQAIATAIRSKNDLTTLYKVSQMAAAINALRMATDVLPQDEVTGSLANFPDGSDNFPVVDLTVDIDYNANGWTGCNIVDMSDITNKPYFEGLLNGTYGFVDLGTLNWTKTSNFFRAETTLPKINENNSIISLDYTKANPYATQDDNVYLGFNQADTFVVVIRDLEYTDANNFKTAMTGQYLIYELATPTTPTITEAQFNTLLNAFELGGWLKQISFVSADTVYGGTLNVTTGLLTSTKAADGTDLPESIEIQLTPSQVNTIYGDNNIFADTGDVDVTYRADVDLYIQKKINEAT